MKTTTNPGTPQNYCMNLTCKEPSNTSNFRVFISSKRPLTQGQPTPLKSKACLSYIRKQQIYTLLCDQSDKRQSVIQKTIVLSTSTGKGALRTFVPSSYRHINKKHRTGLLTLSSSFSTRGEQSVPLRPDCSNTS